MIYTITLNPSIDYIVQIDQLNLGGLNRMKQDYKLPGGKGINVSRVLNQLNVPSLATGFFRLDLQAVLSKIGYKTKV